MRLTYTSNLWVIFLYRQCPQSFCQRKYVSYFIERTRNLLVYIWIRIFYFLMLTKYKEKLECEWKKNHFYIYAYVFKIHKTQNNKNHVVFIWEILMWHKTKITRQTSFLQRHTCDVCYVNPFCVPLLYGKPLLCIPHPQYVKKSESLQ